jgi:hypothetical protein
MVLLNEQLLIAKKLGHKPNPNALDNSTHTLDNEVGQSPLDFAKVWGRIFYFLFFCDLPM